MDNLDEFSSTVELQVDASSGHLGSPKIVTPTKASTSSHKLSSRCEVRGKVTRLQHGFYEGQPASLICFEVRFTFDSSSSSSRFTKAEVRVSFDKVNEEIQNLVTAPEIPVIMNFEPKTVTKPATEVQESQKISIALPLSSIVNVGYEKTEVFTKQYFEAITSTLLCPDDEDIENMVVWTAFENSKQASGVPHKLDLALVVQHNDSQFHGMVEIMAWTNSGLRLFGWPWPRPNPLVFKSDTSIGKSLGVTEFDELTDEQWKGLISCQ